MDFSFFPRDLFSELERLQQQVQQSAAFSPTIRGLARGGYPAVNVGGTADSVQVYAFAPGLEPESIEVNLERGVLSIAGERKAEAADTAKATVHIRERFSGRFHRVIALPDDLDPNAVEAKYNDGVLQISVKRSAASQPRRINVN